MFEQKHSDLLQRFANKFGVPHNGDEDARRWTMKLAEQFNYTFHSEGWGTKRASPTRPPSSDAIARYLDGRLVAYDTVNSAGGPDASLNPNPAEMDINDQVFIAVNPVNHLGNNIPKNTTYLGKSLFWALGGFKKYKTQLENNLFAIRTDLGADYVRWFLTVGSVDGGAGQDPYSDIGAFYDWPDHLRMAVNLMNLLDSFGLKSHLTLVGAYAQADTAAKRDAIVDRASVLAAEFPNSFVCMEMWNEYIVNEAERSWLRSMARRLRDQVPQGFPIALSSPDSVMHMESSSNQVLSEINAMYGGDSGANMMTIHNSRPSPVWRTESIRELGIKIPILEGEPRGPGASAGGDVRNPEIIGQDYLSAVYGKAMGYTLHSMEGIWGGHCDPRWNDQNEWANCYEMPNWGSISSVLKEIRLTGEPPIEPPSGGPDKLMPGQRLYPGQRLTSPNGKYYMEYLPTDGNLVIYETDVRPIWSSKTSGYSLGYLEMQKDGNFVLYSAEGPIRASGTYGAKGAMIQLQDDGNLVMLTDHAVWASFSSPFYNEQGEPI